MPDEISIVFKGYNQVDSVLKDLQKSLGGIPKLVEQINKSMAKGLKFDLSKSLGGLDTKNFDKGLKELSKGFAKELKTYKGEFSKAYKEVDAVITKSVTSVKNAEKAKTVASKKAASQIANTWKQHELTIANQKKLQGTADSVYFNSKINKAKSAAVKLSSLEKQGAADVAAQNKAKETAYEANVVKRISSIKKAKEAEARVRNKYAQLEQESVQRLQRAKDNFLRASESSMKQQRATWASFVKQLTMAGAQYLVITESIKRLANAVTKPFKFAIDQVEAFNQAVIKVSALATSFTAAEPGADLAESYQEARQYAEGLVASLFELQKGTFATVQHMMLMTEEMAKQGVFLDVNNEAQKKGFQSMANAVEVIAAGALQKEIQVRQEIRALLLGQVRMNDQLAQQLDRMLSSTGGLKAHLKIWKEQGTEIENIGKLLKGYIAASEDIGKTWTALVTNFRSIIQQVFNKGFKQGYKEIIEFAMKFQKVLEKNTDSIAKEMVLAWQTVKGAVFSVGEFLKLWLGILDMISVAIGKLLPGVDETGTHLYAITGTLDLIITLLRSIEYIFAVALPNGIDSVKFAFESLYEMIKNFKDIGKDVLESPVTSSIASASPLFALYKKLKEAKDKAFGTSDQPIQMPGSSTTQTNLLKRYDKLQETMQGRETEFAAAGIEGMGQNISGIVDQVAQKYRDKITELWKKLGTEITVPVEPQFYMTKAEQAIREEIDNLEAQLASVLGQKIVKPKFSTANVAKETDILIAKEQLRIKVLEEQAKREKVIIKLKEKIGELTPIKAAEALRVVEEDIEASIKASLETRLELLSKVSGKGDDIKKTKQDLAVIEAKIDDSEFKRLTNALRLATATKKEIDEKVKLADTSVKIGESTLISVEEQIEAVKALYALKEQSLNADISINTEEKKAAALLTLQTEERLKLNEITQKGFDTKIKLAEEELTYLNLVHAGSNEIIIKEKEILELKKQQTEVNMELEESIKNANIAVLEKLNQDLKTAFTLGDAFNQGLDKWVDDLQDAAKRMKSIGEATAKEMSKAFSDFFFDAFQGDLKDLGDYLTSFFNSMQKTIAGALGEQISGTILSSFGFGSKAPAANAPTGHSGGMIGKPYRVGQGLKMNEVMIKGLAGEGIVSRKGMETLDKINKGSMPGGGAPNVQFNISTPPGTELDESETTVDFNFDTLVVNAVIKARNQDPSFRKAMNI